MCTFCKESPESILHILWSCDKVQLIWKALDKWLERKLKTKILFISENVLLNNYQNDEMIKSQVQLVDTIILIYKQYIYACRCTGADLSFIAGLAKVNNYYKIEKSIAYKNKKVKQFTGKWKIFINW